MKTMGRSLFITIIVLLIPCLTIGALLNGFLQLYWVTKYEFKPFEEWMCKRGQCTQSRNLMWGSDVSLQRRMTSELQASVIEWKIGKMVRWIANPVIIVAPFWVVCVFRTPVTMLSRVRTFIPHSTIYMELLWKIAFLTRLHLQPQGHKGLLVSEGRNHTLWAHSRYKCK